MSELVKLADDLDRLAAVEADTADGEPDNMGDSWHEYAQCFINNHYQIVTALRLVSEHLATNRPAITARQTVKEAARKITTKVMQERATSKGMTLPEWEAFVISTLEQPRKLRQPNLLTIDPAETLEIEEDLTRDEQEQQP